MHLEDSIYAQYRNRKKRRRLEEPLLILKANNIDPGKVPNYLLKLTAIEEICISKVYVTIQMQLVRS